MDDKKKKRDIVNQLKKQAENAKASKETGFINENTGSSIRMDEQGNISIAASKTAQYKMQYATGHATEISLESNTITNRKNIVADEIVINKHKLNPQLIELTDYKKFANSENLALGNLTMFATVLVKAWEPNLKKWVLIRRLMRTPVFSNMLNIPTTPEGMALDDNISSEITEMRKVDNGLLTGNSNRQEDTISNEKGK